MSIPFDELLDMPTCADCGEEMLWDTCPKCGGEGIVDHEPSDDEPYSAFEDCNLCDGFGGWWYCPEHDDEEVAR